MNIRDMDILESQYSRFGDELHFILFKVGPSSYRLRVNKSQRSFRMFDLCLLSDTECVFCNEYHEMCPCGQLNRFHIEGIYERLLKEPAIRLHALFDGKKV